MPPNLKYRPEIDGLRALAILPVIFFHAGFKAFGGGYVGVDVFFVISGYLITSIISEGVKTGTFSYLEFYERRARRILPALFFVMICSAPFALAWLSPRDLSEYARSVVAVIFFVSNIFFWSQKGYFDISGEVKPLLHTWSLSVEEQFYLLFPILLWLSRRYALLRAPRILLLIAALSLASSEILSFARPSFNFFWLPTRAWELMAGALCCGFVPAPNPRRDGALALAGLCAILFAVFAFDESTRMPSLIGVAPVLGACAVLVFARLGTLAQRALAWRPIVGVGLVSYSAYLWHQPLLAFARIRANEPLGAVSTTALIGATLALAWFSWRFIEQPWRGRREAPARSRRALLVTMGAGAAGLIVFGAAGWASHGFPSRVPKYIYDAENFDYAPTFRAGRCFLMPEQNWRDFDDRCFAFAPGVRASIWGDSHAAALSYGLRHELGEMQQLTASACPPVEDTAGNRRPNCRAINEFALKRFGEDRPDLVILDADWIAYDDDTLERKLTSTIERLREVDPSARVIVLGGAPHWFPTLPEILWTRDVPLVAGATTHPSQLAMVENRDRDIRAAAEKAGARFVALTDILCAGGMCVAVAEEAGKIAPIQFDNGHLTDVGALYLAKKIIALITAR